MSGSPNSRGRVGIVAVYAALTACAAYSRMGAFPARALGLDDLWVALLIKHLSFSELLLYEAPVPLGYIIASKPFHALIDHPELSLQVVAFICGLVLIPLSGWVGTRLTGRWEIGLLTAILVMLHPQSGQYAVRVKQFTWDAALTLAVLGVGLPGLDSTRRGRPWFVALVAGAALVASFNTVFAGAIILHLLALRSVLARSVSRDERKNTLLAVIAYDVFAICFYFLRLQGQSKDWLIYYWQRHDGFPPVDSTGFDLEYLWGALRRGYGRWLPRGGWFLAPLPALGAMWLLLRRRTRWQGLAIVALGIALPLAGMILLYPFGGIRTDYYFQPVLALLAAFGVAGITDALQAAAAAASLDGFARRLRTLVPVATAVVLFVLLPFPRTFYGTGFGSTVNKDLVTKMDEEVRPGDLVLLNALARSNVGYYTKRPLDVVFHGPDVNLFRFRLTDPESRGLGPMPALEADIAEGRTPDRVIVIMLISTAWHVDWVERVFRKHGYRVRRREKNEKGTSALWVFQRRRSHRRGT